MPIKVLLTRRNDSPYWMMYYRVPGSTSRRFRSTKTAIRRKADIKAEKWETELNNGQLGGDCTWGQFSVKVKDEYLVGRPTNTVQAYRKAVNSFSRLMGDTRRLKEITGATFGEYERKLLAAGRSINTASTYIGHLVALLGWAVIIKLIDKVPNIKRPKVDRRNMSRGRALTHDEFVIYRDALKVLVSEQYSEKDSALWVRLTNGLWLSGFRIGEARRVTWESGPLRIDMDGGRFPRLIAHSEGHKARRDQIVPITPDFAEFLRETPKSERRGLVFPLTLGARTIDGPLASDTMSDAGKRSGLISEETGNHVTAHDLRRSFGTRWAMKVQPAVLRELMRHADIATTMKYYVGINADTISAELWGSVDATVDKRAPSLEKPEEKQAKNNGKN